MLTGKFKYSKDLRFHYNVTLIVKPHEYIQPFEKYHYMFIEEWNEIFEIYTFQDIMKGLNLSKKLYEDPSLYQLFSLFLAYNQRKDIKRSSLFAIYNILKDRTIVFYNK